MQIKGKIKYERKIITAIKALTSPFSMVEIGEQTGLSMKEIRTALIRMSLSGVIRRVRADNNSWEYYVDEKGSKGEGK